MNRQTDRQIQTKDGQMNTEKRQTDKRLIDRQIDKYRHKRLIDRQTDKRLTDTDRQKWIEKDRQINIDKRLTERQTKD